MVHVFFVLFFKNYEIKPLMFIVLKWLKNYFFPATHLDQMVLCIYLMLDSFVHLNDARIP